MMGNATSQVDYCAHLPIEVNAYEGFVRHESGFVVEEQCFLEKFGPSLESLGKAFWSHYRRDSSQNVMHLTEYEEIVNRLSCRGRKIDIFIDLVHQQGSDCSEFNLDLLLSWLNFGDPIDTVLSTALLQPIKQTSQCVMDMTTLSKRLSVHFPDIGEDLSKLIYQFLTQDIKLWTRNQLNKVKEFGAIMSEDVFWLLSLILSAPYKRFSETSLCNSAPLEIEQLSHMVCLYTSASHGFSVTRIKELAFEYNGPIILLLKTVHDLFCLASDEGLKDTLKPYGAQDSKLFRILPNFAKLLSGRSQTSSGRESNTGIIYSNFTAKTARRGLLIGHQPIASPALEVSDTFNEIRFAGGESIKLIGVEIWAAGSQSALEKMTDYKAWEREQVNKEKNRKFKLDDDWKDSADRSLLSMAGVNVRHAEAIGPIKSERSDGDKLILNDVTLSVI